MQNHVMYIFINDDLDMSKGQIIAQCCHITQIITEELVMKCYEEDPVSQVCIDYLKWKRNPTTVILKANTEQLNQLKAFPTAKHFIDSGNRVINDSLTVVGFYPNSDLKDIVKEYKLL